MDEHFAVVFRDGTAEQAAAGVLELEQDRLRLRGRTNDGAHELEIPFTDLSEVRIARSPTERLNGYATLVLERTSAQAVQIAPLGIAFLPQIADLLAAVTQRTDGDGLLAVLVPLKPGCLDRARALLAKRPPLDPALLGLNGHEVYLDGSEAVFVFRGDDIRARVGKAMRHPAVWRAGLDWQSCFAGPPQIVDATHTIQGPPAYRWTPAAPQPRP
jgi:hypothetical protein